MSHGAEAQQGQQEAADTTDQAQPSGRWQPPAASDSEDDFDEGGSIQPSAGTWCLILMVPKIGTVAQQQARQSGQSCSLHV